MGFGSEQLRANGGDTQVKNGRHIFLKDDRGPADRISQRFFSSPQEARLAPGMIPGREWLIDHLSGVLSPEITCFVRLVRDQGLGNRESDLFCEGQLPWF